MGTRPLGINGAPGHGASMGHQWASMGINGVGIPLTRAPPRPITAGIPARSEPRQRGVAPPACPAPSTLRPASFPPPSSDWLLTQPLFSSWAYESAGEAARPGRDWRRGRANGGAAAVPI